MKKRFIVFSVAMCFLFSAVLGRMSFIVFSGAYKVSSAHNSYTVNIDKIYETVYDRNLSRLTNKSDELIAVIRPTQKCITELNNLFTYKEREEIIEELKQGYPVMRKTDSYVNCKYIKIFETISRHSSDMIAKDMISFCEKINPEPIGSKSINFSVDAVGRLLDGDEGTVIENNYNSKRGTVLTIDSKIQKTVEKAAEDMKKGAVVVLDITTGEVLASLSKSDDYINRAFSAYCVGSVYKIVVASCAIENNIEVSYECNGEITVGDTTFSCQKKTKHGKQTMKEALANSCNCYFINLALELGDEKLIATSEKFGFGKENNVINNISISNGNFPDSDFLQSKGQLALIGFGQGSLTDSPLHFSSVVSAIANGGIYKSPKFISGRVDDKGEFYENNNTTSKRIISAKTAETIRDYMRYVVTNGSGKNADYNDDSAGKTSTAQSGIMDGDREILYTWFAGFYPYSDPKYSIVVMTEDGKSGSEDCCPIFRTIVENL